MRSRLMVAAAAVAALTATGCGERMIDVAKSAKATQRAIEEQVGADVKSMSCPVVVKVKAKSAFTCVVTAADGTTGNATLTQTDGTGTITARAPFLPRRLPEQSIQADLRRRSPRATVVCPQIIVMKAGGTFECKANLGEINETIVATQTNARGNFTYTVKALP